MTDPYLEATLEKTSTLASILVHLNFQKDSVVIVTVLPAGCKFTVEDSRILQATVFLSREFFSEWRFNGAAFGAAATTPALQFCVPLNPLCEVLNIFGTHEPTAMKMTFQRPGMDLFLVLTQGPTLANVSLRTLESEGPINFFFRNPQTPVRNKLIIRSEALKAAFAELDWSSVDIQLVLSPEDPYFRIATVGPGGSCQVDFARDSPTIEEFESFEGQAMIFKLKYLQPVIKALSGATKTQIRMNSIGMLNVMHLIATEDGQTSFIEFFLLPSTDD